MYPDISPDLKVKSTISHPIRSEEVIGFVGRNTLLGRPAVIMKEDAVDTQRVVVPTGASEGLINGVGELVVLDGDVVLTMDAEDFALECGLHTVEGRGSEATMNSVSRDSDKFLSWDESMVEVGN